MSQALRTTPRATVWRSVKSGLKKSAVKLTSGHLNELIFAINTTTSSEGTGSPADRFFGRSVRSRLPNSVDPGIKSNELIEKRIKKHDARITNKNKRNKVIYQVGQRVRLQNVATRDWDLKGTIERLRYADDGRVVSYFIMTDKNHLTTRHRRFLKPLHEDHDPKLTKNNIYTENYATRIADLQLAESGAPRRSGRLKLSSKQAVKVVVMGAEFSTPFTANIELNFGGNEDVVTVCEVSRRSVPNSGIGRRPQQQRAQGQAERHSAAGGGPQQRHQGQAEQGCSTGGSAASGGPQQWHQGQAEQGCSTGGGGSLMNQRSQARAGIRQNVGFFKAGNLHIPAGQGVQIGGTNMASQERRRKESL